MFKGVRTDSESRCIHYHLEKDIVSIKFYCCGTYYSCYKCHQELSDHKVIPWPKDSYDSLAILCGACQTELSIGQYIKTSQCPHCTHAFNEKCELHYDIYFCLSAEDGGTKAEGEGRSKTRRQSAEGKGACEGNEVKIDARGKGEHGRHTGRGE
ncbi:CHY zinc finger protein [Alkalihalobacillus pseudalcaliphilus]|uniref:CHY zinc finger protein n=1 Tax=Alkalihalobacillus pseudalcaliphilus TaxID=79884 RepID=UPI000840A26B